MYYSVPLINISGIHVAFLVLHFLLCSILKIINCSVEPHGKQFHQLCAKKEILEIIQVFIARRRKSGLLDEFFNKRNFREL